ncbi:MAG TPA: undecaprenyl-phosphate galactose phosphotransferase WbaP [Trueperaceae bacterium]
MTLSIQRGASFLVGVGFSLLPAIAPFIAVIFFLSVRWRPERRDIIGLSGAVLFSLPLLLHSGAPAALLSLLQLVAAWLLYRAFARLGELQYRGLNGHLLARGLLAGLALIVLLGSLQIVDLNRLGRLWQTVIWDGSPALYAHTVLVLGGAIALLTPERRLRLVSLGLSATAILISGSREAAIAWVVMTLGFLLLTPAFDIRRRVAEWIVFALMLVVTAGLGSLLGWGHFGFLLDITPASENRNMLQGTEIPGGAWWFEQGAERSEGSATIDGIEYSVFEVWKTEPEGWRRLQQVVPIEPRTPYTLSGWIRAPKGGARPGFHGWGEDIGGAGVLIVEGALSGGSWVTSVTGPGAILGSGIADSWGEWRRVWISFEYSGDETLYWWAGLAPDQRQALGEPAQFAGFQLEEGVEPTAYMPGPATQGLGLSTARIPYWQAAAEGIADKPLLGWGTYSFEDYFRHVWRDQSQLLVVPVHTHNLLLQTLFERGVVGLVGLMIYVLALLSAAVKRLDFGLLVVIAAVLVANMFDYTLLYGGVLYPLASVAGWRAGTRRGVPAQREAVARQAIVRLSLATTDLLMAFAALLLAFWMNSGFGSHDLNTSWTGLPSISLYALLLWPILSWREGLYPGYGTTAPEELRKQVSVAFWAWILLAVGAYTFPDALAFPRPQLYLMGALVIVALPVGRAACKRLLHLGDMWGEPVVVLGGGATGSRVVKALNAYPLDGLKPVSVFDDDPDKVGTSIDGVPVLGAISKAAAWGAANGVSRAISALGRTPPDIKEIGAADGRRSFKKVQFIPDLQGLPVLGVQAGSLDNLLALEVRNELAVPLNRVVKRSIDIVASIALLAALSPLLLALSLAIRLDSPGPVLYNQRRIGRNGRPFRIWKFRSMVANADAALSDWLDKHPELRSEWQSNQKLLRDPRITRVGVFLRSTSLDELPQLINVVLGQMSLVGPRPIVDSEAIKYERTFDLYQMVRPGMTGHWQVSGRSDTGYGQRVELDSFYVRNWSVWLDIIILIRTIGVVLRRKGAY